MIQGYQINFSASQIRIIEGIQVIPEITPFK